MFFSHAIPHYTMLLLWQSHSEAGTVELTICPSFWLFTGHSLSTFLYTYMFYGTIVLSKKLLMHCRWFNTKITDFTKPNYFFLSGFRA